MNDSIKSADRRLKLLLLLQSGKNLSVNKIADYFMVSRRTVFRDLRALQDMEVPVMYEPNEGYSLIKGYKVPPLMFNERELASILLGLSFIQSQIDTSMSEDAKDVILKIKNAISSELLQFVNTIESKIITSPYFNESSESPKSSAWFVICQAISDLSAVKISYQTDTEETQRKIHPYIIVFYEDHWNVLAWDESKNAVRSFKLERIVKAEVLAERFEAYSEDLNLLLYRFKSESIKTFAMSIAKAVSNDFFKKFPGLILKKEERQDQIYCEFQFDNQDWLTIFLIPFLPHLKIHSEKLRFLLAEKLDKLKKLI